MYFLFQNNSFLITIIVKQTREPPGPIGGDPARGYVMRISHAQLKVAQYAAIVVLGSVLPSFNFVVRPA